MESLSLTNSSWKTAGAPTAATPQQLRLAIVIVHYRTPELLEQCLRSLRPEVDLAQDRIIVVDNASNDGSIEALRKLENITLVASPVNLGFAGANNLGISAAWAPVAAVDAAADAAPSSGPAYFLLLNPDTIVRPGALKLLREFLETHPAAGLVGPRLEGPDGAVQLSSFGDPSPLSELIRGANIGPLTRLLKSWQVYGCAPETPQPVDWLSGACLMARASTVASAGLLDAGYFMYFEEVEWCRRMRAAGSQCWHLPAARVVHLVGQASGLAGQMDQKRLPAYWFASRQRYFRQHYGWLGTVLADGLYVLGMLISRLRRLLTGTMHSNLARRELRDLLAHELRALCRGITSRQLSCPQISQDISESNFSSARRFEGQPESEKKSV